MRQAPLVLEDVVSFTTLTYWGITTEVISVCPGAPFARRSLWIGIAMILWTFNIQKSEELNPKTGTPFVYDDSDAAFSGEVKAFHPVTRYVIANGITSSQVDHLSFPLCLNPDRNNVPRLLDKSGTLARR